jgi:HAD superfamily hydrolase (TIGR01509 family)
MPYRDDWLRRRQTRPPLAMVIFDCDGVLIDSEAISNRIVAEDLTALGWPMTTEEAEHRFIGLSFHDMLPMIEAGIGRRLDDTWVEGLVERVVAAMAREVEMMPGARDALHATTALGLPWRIASNSSHAEMTAKFTRNGLTTLVSGRTHSGHDIVQAGGRGKPAPDVYLDAARAEGIDPAACLAIEDSIPGIAAAVAAGMDCLGLGPASRDDAMRAAGATPFRSMHDLPALLRRAREPRR